MRTTIKRQQIALERTLADISPLHGYEKQYGVNVFPYHAPETTVQFHGQGLGDVMIIRQFGRALHDYFSEYGDPELGEIVIATGGFEPAFDPDPGDLNLYWWWSFGRFDHEPGYYLDHYLEQTTVDPDAILCLSNECVREANQRGYDTLKLPLGTYAFTPLEFSRSGIGYAGTPDHKSERKEALVLNPFKGDEEFQFVSHFAHPEQLNLWYNTKLLTLGLHREGQRQWGMVNNRVFETLASGTPFILEAHPTVEDILGFEFPYQTSSKEETVDLAESIKSNPNEAIEEFREYSETVREHHSYRIRVRDLLEFLS